ncbi:MAG: hypothetical protein ABIP75_11305, partial [Pyrinomonadaceae bacterium]
MKKYSFCTLIAVLAVLIVIETTNAQHGSASNADAHRDVPAEVTLSTKNVSVPLAIDHRKPVVDVLINGKGPFKFFL